MIHSRFVYWGFIPIADDHRAHIGSIHLVEHTHYTHCTAHLTEPVPIYLTFGQPVQQVNDEIALTWYSRRT